MDAALGWFGELVRVLGQVFPRLVHVLETEQAVKFVRGRSKVLGPGLHWYWPVTSEVVSEPVVRQVMELNTQTLVTADGRTVVVGGVVTYSIVDLHAFLVENHDAADNVAEAALAGIRKAVLETDLAELQEGRAKADNRLARQVQRAVAGFGVEVESARLATLAPAHVLSIVGDGFQTAA